MITSDYHMHTAFSIDSEAKMEDMVQKAIELGMEEIAITDHIDFEADGVTCCNKNDYSAYIKEFTNLKDKYASKINLIFGVEFGLGRKCKKSIETFAEKYPYEFVIGSCHSIDGLDICFEKETVFKNMGKKEIYGIYLEDILFNIKNFDFINIIGHLDYIIRYPSFKDNKLYVDDFDDYITEIYKEIISRGKGIEINASGYRYGFKEPHPSRELIAKYKEMGGEVITIGSDAHVPRCIGENFNEIENLLKDIGFKAYTRFKNGKPYWVSLK